MALLILLMAFVSVGLTAPTDGPFSIEIKPIFLRLGVDIDVKIGSMHFHLGWSALPISDLTTITQGERL